MHYDLHEQVVGTAYKCKKVTYTGNGVHAMDAVNIGGGDTIQ